MFGVFLPYFACGGVFLFCRGPRFSRKKKQFYYYLLNLGGAISPPKFWGGASETPCFAVFAGGCHP